MDRGHHGDGLCCDARATECAAGAGAGAGAAVRTHVSAVARGDPPAAAGATRQPCVAHMSHPLAPDDPSLFAFKVEFGVWRRTLMDGLMPSHHIRITRDYWTMFMDHPVAFCFLGFTAFEQPRLLLFLYLLGGVFPPALVPQHPTILELLPLPTLAHPLFLPVLLYLANPQLALFLIGRAMFSTSPATWYMSAVLRSFAWCMALRALLNFWLWRTLVRAPRLDDGHNVPPCMAWTLTLSSRELKALGWLAFAFLKFCVFFTLTCGVHFGHLYLRPLLYTLHVSCTHWFVVFAHLIFGLCTLPLVAACQSRDYTPSPFFFFNALSDQVVKRYWHALHLLSHCVWHTRATARRVVARCRRRLTALMGGGGGGDNLNAAGGGAPGGGAPGGGGGGHGDDEFGARPLPQWMSEAGPMRLENVQGYPKYLFHNLPDNVMEELTCPICCEAVRHAVAVAHCGHLYCHACLRLVLSHQSTCPVCRCAFDKYGVNVSLAVRRMLLGMTVACPYQGDLETTDDKHVPLSSFSPKRGRPSGRKCVWRGTLQALDTHVHVWPGEDEDDGGGGGGGSGGSGEPSPWQRAWDPEKPPRSEETQGAGQGCSASAVGVQDGGGKVAAEAEKVGVEEEVEKATVEEVDGEVDDTSTHVDADAGADDASAPAAPRPDDN